MRGLGGLSIKRSQSINRVEQAINEIKASEHFVLVITPEGTRSKVKRWKTGFYHIAVGASIPVVPIALDFQYKKVIIGTPIAMTGEVTSDFKKMHGFFLAHRGKHPELECNEPYDNPEVYLSKK